MNVSNGFIELWMLSYCVPWVADDGPSDRDALLLATRHLYPTCLHSNCCIGLGNHNEVVCVDLEHLLYLLGRV